MKPEYFTSTKISDVASYLSKHYIVLVKMFDAFH